MAESSVNPLGYKFSWSPKGVLTACTKPAKYLHDHKIVEVNGFELFKKKQAIDIFPGFSLEGIPNRDATIYKEQYGIQDEVKTLFRGTLRYKGFSEIMEAIVDIGLLSEEPKEHLSPNAPDLTWNQNMRTLIGATESKLKTKHFIKKMLRARNGFPSKGYDDDKLRRIMKAFEWLDLFSDKKVIKKGTYLDTVCELLQDKLAYQKGESDMIILHHIFGIEWQDGSKELKTSTLVFRGDSQAMAMAKTVGLPVGIACDLLLNGTIPAKGVIGPMSPEIFIPMLKSLKNEGIKFIEKSEVSKKLFTKCSDPHLMEQNTHS